MADENVDTYTEKKPSEKPTVPRTATELQKLKLDKLMKDPVSRNSVVIRDWSSWYFRSFRVYICGHEFVSWNQIMPCRIKRCLFPIVQTNGNHQRHLSLFDLWWVGFLDSLKVTDQSWISDRIRKNMPAVDSIKGSVLVYRFTRAATKDQTIHNS